jgi:acetate kinase
MKILVINCGSSSLKYEVYEMPAGKSLGKGLIERIGLNDAKISQDYQDRHYSSVLDIPDHAKAFKCMMQALLHDGLGILDSIDEIKGIGHRVVHGGEQYSQSVLIDDGVIKAIEDNIELAPLHNPANLTGIMESQKILPGIPQVAVFDTAFHQTLPPVPSYTAFPRVLREIPYSPLWLSRHQPSLCGRHRLADAQTQQGQHQPHHLSFGQWRIHHSHSSGAIRGHLNGLYSPGRPDDGNPQR